MSDDTARRPDREIDARIPGGRLRSWFVLSADRWSVAAALAIALLAVLLAPTFPAPDLLTAAIGDGDEVDTLFQALVAGIVTGPPGVEAVVWAVGGCAGVALLPFLLLLPNRLRVTTVTQRTLAIGP